MQKNTLKTLILTIFPLILLILSCKIRENSLTIATAANMQFAMKALAEAYTAETGNQVELVVSSSGKLTAQIRQGAPYDLFFSADTKYPQAIYETGLGTDKPTTYAYGQLVLWSTNEEMQITTDLLTSDQVQHIAIANPKTAPYGAAAITALKRLEIYDQVKSKLVYGESISQVNQFIISKAADVGFTAKSVVMSERMQNVGKWEEIHHLLHEPIAQAAVVLKTDRGLESEAQLFLQFVKSEKGLSILRNFGYR